MLRNTPTADNTPTTKNDQYHKSSIVLPPVVLAGARLRELPGRLDIRTGRRVRPTPPPGETD